MAAQPIIGNSNGAILTIGMVCDGERVAIVEPWGLDATGPDPATLCQDLIDSWQAAVTVTFLACLASDAYIAFLEANGMQDGRVPYRSDYTSAAFPGTASGTSLPSNVTGLIAYYQTPADVPAGHRIRVAKTFMPGVPYPSVTGNVVAPAQTDLYTAYGAEVQAGITSVLYPGQSWWRMLATPKPRSVAQTIPRTINCVARGYVCTQRRRLIPR